MAGAEIEGWREVAVDGLGTVRGPHFMRARAFAIWKAEEPFFGIFTLAPQSVADIEGAWAAYGAYRANGGEPASGFSDARGFRADGPSAPIFEFMLREGPRFVRDVAGHMLRCATVVPSGWLRPWWIGAIAAGLVRPIPCRATRSTETAWRWLGAPASLPARVAALTEAIGIPDRVRAQVEHVLRADPSLDLAGVARRLGLSPRSLQRELGGTDEGFAGLRSRIRFEHAVDRVARSDDKIEEIATAVGFRSRSHFVTWFQKLTGISPRAFRERDREPRRHAVR